MRSLVCLGFLVLAAGCVTPRSSSSSPSSAKRAQACAFDSECPGGSCRQGECSGLSPDEKTCSFDSDCPGGSCDSGRCSTSPPPPPTTPGMACTGGADCSQGTCQGPDCR